MTINTLQILLIEDNPADASLVDIYLEDAFRDSYSLTKANSIAQGLKSVTEKKFDIIISDIALPDGNGMDIFIHEPVVVSNVPIIVLTGNRDESLGIEAVKRGAADFLNKNELNGTALKRSIEYSIERNNLQRELRKTNARLEQRVTDRTNDLKQTIKQLEHEIEQRKKNESEIKTLSFLISKTDNAIFITDKTGKIRWVNEGFTRLSGYSLEDIAGTYGEVLRKGDQTGLHPASPFFDKIYTEKQTVFYESHNYRKDGTEYWTICTLTPILNDKGEVESVVAVDSDISTIKKIEKELMLANRIAEHSLMKGNKALNELKSAQAKLQESMRVKELFIANMSHEIRTPMNAIMGIVQLMHDTELSSSQKQYLRGLQFAGESLLCIINDILDMSKIESGKFNIEKIEFNLLTLLEDIVYTMEYRAKEKNIEMLVDLQQDIPVSLVGDPVRLNQILTNLIGNAIKFTEKGYVKLIIQEKEKQSGKVTLSFDVDDTGIGIAKEKQNLVFDAFEQAQMETSRKYGGTGLGLYIVKRLVELQGGGAVRIQSELGKGAKFSFELTFPIVEKTQIEQATNKQPEIKKIDLSEKEVLLVEDNSLNQMVAEKFLGVMGLKIEIAENGVEAINMLKKKNYDLILMDIQMPEMDGYEATRCIRNTFEGAKKNIPILAMTAHALHGEEEKCRRIGMNDYISKPINKNVLLDKVRRLLNPNTNPITLKIP